MRPHARPSSGDPRVRAIVWQSTVVALVCTLIALIAMQTAANLRVRGIATGFGYLNRAAGFEIARGPLSYSSRDTYLRALGVGLVNTLRVSALGVVMATAIGVVVGFARLSHVRFVATISQAYIEILRNVPLLLQLFFWYSLSERLPGPRDALRLLPGVLLCKRGLYLPALAWHGGAPGLDYPVLAGFDLRGGVSISPEFAALLAGLATYTSAFIGEIVRGGILAVDKGQIEAAAALGLSRARVQQLVVLPQALRLIVPPTTSQFLSLTKNSSLAVAIGYPDLISITNTTLNQTGQAVEAIVLAMIVYLAISLTISLAMNLYNRRIVARGGR